MKAPSEKHFIHGGIFVLANRLQLVGDMFTGDITTKQWFMLVAVATSDIPQPAITDIAKDLGCSRQNVSRMLSTLVAKGYLVHEPSKEDARKQCIRLTAKAAEKMAEISAMGQRFIERLFEGVEDAQVLEGVRLIEQLNNNLLRIENGDSI